jgi:mannitol/fructose-specific phosphotransferase system IIA component (Ntr-type)
MELKEFLSYFEPELFIKEFKANTKEEAIIEIAKCLESSGRIFRAEIIIDLLKKREQLGTTAIGKGIAIPHCRSMATEKMTVVVGIKSKGIDFDAPDKLPVKLIFVIIAPPQDVNYLPFLGKLVELIRDESVRKRLMRIRSLKGLKNVITEFMNNE